MKLWFSPYGVHCSSLNAFYCWSLISNWFSVCICYNTYLYRLTASERKGRNKISSHFLLWTGYIIYYSTDVNAEIHDWVIEPVVGNRLTHQIQELTLDTPYYFKIQARNSKGMGPMSEAVQFRTPKGKAPLNGVLFYVSLVGQCLHGSR